MGSAREEMEAIFNHAEKNDGNVEGYKPEATPPASSEPEGEQGRTPDGRFAGKTPATVEPIQSTPPASPPATPPATPPQGTPPALDISQPPRGWRPEYKAQWDALPKEVREEVMRREEAAMQGVQRLQDQHKPAAELHQSLAQYDGYFKHIKAEPVPYLHEVIRSEQTLALGNPAQKMDMLLALADKYGVPLRATLDQAMGGKLNETLRASHERFKTPPQVPPEVQQELNEMRQWRQNMESQAAQAELDAFVKQKDKYPLYDEIKEKMADALEKGMVDSYEDAYSLVVFRDPALRQRQAAIEAGQAQGDALRQRQAAAATIVPPASAPIQSAAPEGLDSDDVHDVVRAAIAANTGRV